MLMGALKVLPGKNDNVGMGVIEPRRSLEVVWQGGSLCDYMALVSGSGRKSGWWWNVTTGAAGVGYMVDFQE